MKHPVYQTEIDAWMFHLLQSVTGPKCKKVDYFQFVIVDRIVTKIGITSGTKNNYFPEIYYLMLTMTVFTCSCLKKLALEEVYLKD